VEMVEREELWRMMEKTGIIISRGGDKLGVGTDEGRNQKQGKDDCPQFNR